MTLRVAAFLGLAWANVFVAWAVLAPPGSSGGSGGVGTILRVWWLVLLALMASLSLFSLMVADPGLVVPSPDTSTVAQQLCGPEGAAVAQQEQYFTQFCSLCSYQKPARAHHCRICNRCILKMDHHCHWVGRCVGRGNYKSYLLVLFYGCMASGAMLVVLWRRWQYGAALSPLNTWAMAIDGLLVLMVFLSVSYLVIFHAYLVAINVTTIEYYKWKRSMRDPAHYGPPARPSLRQSQYNRGLYANVCEVLGDNILLWLLPVLLNRRCRDSVRVSCCRGCGSGEREAGRGGGGAVADWLGRKGEGTRDLEEGTGEGQSSLVERRGSNARLSGPQCTLSNDEGDDEVTIELAMRRPNPI